MAKTFRRTASEHPEILNHPVNDPNRYPKAFEEALLMIVEQNHFNPRRMNIENPLIMDGFVEKPSGEVLFYYDAEYSASNIFDENGTFKHPNVRIPIEKIKYFKKYLKSVYVRGNLKHVLVLRGAAILEAYKKGKITKSEPVIMKGRPIAVERDFIRVPTKTAIKNNNLRVAPLTDWLVAAKSLFPMDLWL